MIVSSEIVEKLCKNLSLPYSGEEQDWDIELANPHRIDDFFAFYKEHDLSDEMRYAVMSLILSSYDDFLNQNNLDLNFKWDQISVLLETDRALFSDLIQYWSVENEKTDVFAITPLIRKIKKAK